MSIPTSRSAQSFYFDDMGLKEQGKAGLEFFFLIANVLSKFPFRVVLSRPQ